MMIVSIYLLFSMLAVLWFDVTRYVIPNWLVGSLLALYPVAVFLVPMAVDWPMAIAGMAVVFAVGYVIFAMRWMGGGDVKLLSVCALWVGWQGLLEYLVRVAVLGGVLSVALLLVRQVAPNVIKGAALPRLLRSGEPVPYGIAIAIGFLWMMAAKKIPILLFMH